MSTCDVCGSVIPAGGSCHGQAWNRPPTNNDSVDHPKHYTSHPSGVEAITVCEHMGFNLGNAMKYIWRTDLKSDAIEDLEKAKWYLEREISNRRAQTKVRFEFKLY